ncbi:unnamed protein product [Discosporangium mesarthrocarpum]
MIVATRTLTIIRTTTYYQVGGYLAFIGLFCLEAGLALCSGKDIRGPLSWGTLLNKRDILLCTPCVVLGFLLSWVSRQFQHFSVLPGCMLAVPMAFYLGLLLSGLSMQARGPDGWGVR